MYFNGTKSCALLLASFLSLSLSAKDLKTVNTQGLNKPLCFIENRGQVTDQQHHQLTDIQYKLSTPGMSLYVGNGQLHYQFQKTEESKLSTYRMDVTLLGANPHAKVISEDPRAYYENYFQGSTSKEALTVHSFGKIIYKEIYPGIDWVLYVKKDKIEYDFIVHPGANIKDIKLKYDGATALNTNKDGSIVAETPLGTVKENTPYSYETETGKPVASNFVLHDNVLSFEAGAYNGTLTIDPFLFWSTYFGGANEDVATSVKETTTGVTFVGGYTSSTGLGTPGVVRVAYALGLYDGFLAKYDVNGALLFTTYFGGTNSDRVSAIALDNTGFGNPSVYIAGTTNSPTLSFAVPATAYLGGNDGFVAKINNTGTALTWHTFFGGTGNDNINAMTCDAGNNVYITGRTASLASVAFPVGSVHQSTRHGINDAFVAKINGGTGAKTWATYYGGSAEEEAFGIALDGANNVFITGQTNSVVDIATTGAHKIALSGTNDAFLAKFTSSGSSLTWGTYLGGTGEEQGNGIACNQSTGEVALIGSTTSSSDIATPKAFQLAYAGGPQDAFVNYFDASGVRQWGTYFGGNMPEYGQGILIDNSDNVIITGGSFSSTGIASDFAAQGTKGGDYDAFVGKFNSVGQRLWSTYFGGLYYDLANAIAVDNSNLLTIAGYTTSAPGSGLYGADGLATPGAAQGTFMGGVYDAFVTKFDMDTYLEIDKPFTDVLVCTGGTFTVNYTVNNNFVAPNTFTLELSNASGSFAAPVAIGTSVSTTSGAITGVIPVGTPLGTHYRVRITASNPGYVSPDNFYDITVVSALPAISISATTPTCVGNLLTLFASATYDITAYNWSGPAGSGPAGTGFTSTLQNPINSGFFGSGVTLDDNGIYTVVTSHNGCPDKTTTINVVVNDIPTPTPIATTDALSCAGSSINLYANPDTTSPDLIYHWSGPSGFTSTMQNPVITGAGPLTAGVYSLYDEILGCASPVTTVTVTVTDTNHVTIKITADPNDTVCKGTLVNFTSTTTNGGVSPTYQWYTGSGALIVGAMSDVFASSTLMDGQTIYCIVKSNLICPTPINGAVSNVITMGIISNPPVVKIFSSTPHVKAGDSVVFTSIIYNGGTAPLYQWKKNGRNIVGATDDIYVLNNVTRTDTITLELTSTMMCATPNYGVSNAIVTTTTVNIADLTSSLGVIELFPNPNNGSFTLKGNYSGSAVNEISISVLNLVGQVIYMATANTNNNTINKNIELSNVPDGVYLLRVANGTETKTLRFSVTR